MAILKAHNSFLKANGKIIKSAPAPYGLPFPDGEPLVYNGKTYRTKRIQNLLMQVEFFDEPVYFYNVHYGIKYYKATSRFNVEALVSSMGWRLPLDADIDFIVNEIEAIKADTGYSYAELLGTQSNRWTSSYRGDNLTGIGMDPTGYDYHGNISLGSERWYSWSGSRSSLGNGAVDLERIGNQNFGTGRNCNDGNYLPIIFVKNIT